MGFFQWGARDQVEPRWADNDAVDGIALYRSAGFCLGRPNRIGCRWRIHPALHVVDHGRTIRRKISNASVLHDVAYGDHNRPWQDCDRMFYYAMRCSGVSAIEA